MTKLTLTSATVAVALLLAGCGSSNDSTSATAQGRTLTAIDGRVTVETPEETASKNIELDAYDANVTIADYCADAADARELSHAIDRMIDYHRDAGNADSLRLVRDAAAMLRGCSDVAGDRVGLDAADRLTAAAGGS